MCSQYKPSPCYAFRYRVFNQSFKPLGQEHQKKIDVYFLFSNNLFVLYYSFEIIILNCNPNFAFVECLKITKFGFIILSR